MSVVTTLRLGPSDRTPERLVALRRATIQSVRDRLSDISSVSAAAWIRIGGELDGERKACEEERVPFTKLFARNAAERADSTKFPFSYSTARQLICIAKSQSVNAINTLSCLPSSWGTLYIVSTLPTDRLAALIQSGGVHPTMSQAEAKRLAQTPRVKRPTPTKLDKAHGAYLAQIKRLSAERRAREVLHIAADCGLTIEQLIEASRA